MVVLRGRWWMHPPCSRWVCVVAVVEVFNVVWLSDVDTVVEPVVSVPVWAISVTKAFPVKANIATESTVTVYK